MPWLKQRGEYGRAVAAANQHNAVAFADYSISGRAGMHIAVAAVDLHDEESSPRLPFDGSYSHAHSRAVGRGGDYLKLDAEAAQHPLEAM
jgi:hypothetical protein